MYTDAMHTILLWLFGIDTSDGWAFHPLASGFWLVAISLVIVFVINGGIGWTNDKLHPKRTHRRKVEAYFRAHPEQRPTSSSTP
jgi:hypothetical protein